MRTLILILLISAATLIGCSRHHGRLDDSTKGRLVGELIDAAPRCDAFREKLNSGKLDDDAVDALYHKAQRSHCVKRDV